MPTTNQDQRIHALMGDYDAVATTPLNGYVSVIARRADGRIARAEVLATDGQPLEFDAAVRRLGEARQNALALAERATEDLITHLALVESPGELNMTQIARDAGIARQTLYNRLDVARAKVARS